MFSTHLRKVGGSIMLALPPAILEMLKLEAGSRVGIMLEGDHLVVQPEPPKRYTLEDLVSQCDTSAAMSEEDKEWLDAQRAGHELI